MNMYSMHVVFKEFSLLHSFCSALFVFQLSVRTDRGRGVVTQKEDRGGRGLKTGENVGLPLWKVPTMDIVY